MLKATDFLSDDERQQIFKAIADAEKETTAEIVCAVSTESGRYDRSESIAGLFGALAFLGIAHVLHAALVGPTPTWNGPAVSVLAIGWQAAAGVVGFIAGALVASYVHPVRRLLVSSKEMAEETLRAANVVFATSSLRLTVGRTGVLVFVSVFERRLVILADEASLEGIGGETLDTLCAEAIEQLKSGKRLEAFTETITKLTRSLADKLPADRDLDSNELADHMLIIHPRP